jgi:hypothetical protein
MHKQIFATIFLCNKVSAIRTADTNTTGGIKTPPVSMLHESVFMNKAQKKIQSRTTLKHTLLVFNLSLSMMVCVVHGPIGG